MSRRPRTVARQVVGREALVRLIVTSATYRQVVARCGRSCWRAIPRIACWPGRRAVRLHAEFIRDQALAVSGLLNAEIGGPASRRISRPACGKNWPFARDGKNWTAQTYTQSHGADLYRRTMYTFWKRTSPPPTLDHVRRAGPRDLHRPPLDDQHAAAGAGAVERSDLRRSLAQAGRANHDRSAGHRPTSESHSPSALATARRPKRSRDWRAARACTNEQLAAYRANAEAAQKLLAVGESPRNEKLDAAELAAWTTVASMILNLDETVTKELKPMHVAQ